MKTFPSSVIAASLLACELAAAAEPATPGVAVQPVPFTERSRDSPPASASPIRWLRNSSEEWHDAKK